MSAVALDLRTLSLVLMMVAVVLSFFMLFVWRTQKTYPGFGVMAAANLAAAIGFLLVGLRGLTPDFVSIILGNLFISGSCVLGFEGVRRFLNRPPQLFFSVGLVGLMMPPLAYFTYVQDNVAARIVTVSIVAAVMGVRFAFEFMKGVSDESKFTYRLAAVNYIVFSLLMVARAVLTPLYSNLDDLLAPDWIQSASFTAFILFVVIWTFIYIALNGERTQQELKATQAELEMLATTDFLTGAANNRRFYEVAENEIHRARRYRHPLTVLMFDLDYFKRVNDTYGHAAGDAVLKRVAQICRETLRNIDVLGRLGGEEFAVLLPYTNSAGGRTVAEFLRSAIEDAEIECSGATIQVTASFGMSELTGTDDRIETVLERADQLLYEAKRAGRNRCVVNFSNTIPTETAVFLENRI